MLSRLSRVHIFPGRTSIYCILNVKFSCKIFFFFLKAQKQWSSVLCGILQAVNCQIGFSTGSIVPVSALYSPPGKGRIISLERCALGLELLRHQGKVRVRVWARCAHIRLYSPISCPILVEEKLATVSEDSTSVLACPRLCVYSSPLTLMQTWCLELVVALFHYSYTRYQLESLQWVFIHEDAAVFWCVSDIVLSFPTSTEWD